MSKKDKAKDKAESSSSGQEGTQPSGVVRELQMQVGDFSSNRKKGQEKSGYDDGSAGAQPPPVPTPARPADPADPGDRRDVVSDPKVQAVDAGKPAQKPADANSQPAIPPTDQRTSQSTAKSDVPVKPDVPQRATGGGSDAPPAPQPPPNQIVPPANPTPSRQFEQPHASLPSNRTVDAPPLANPPAAQRNPIAGPPPSEVPKPPPDVVPGAPAGRGVLEAKITYEGSPQQVAKAVDNRQAVPVDGAANQKDAIRDRFVAPENVVKTGDKAYHAPFIAEDGKMYRIVSPSPAPGMGHAALSASGNALLVTNQKQREQYQQDVAKYGQQEAIRRLEEEQKRVASGASKSDRSSHESMSESKTPRSEQAPESKGTKPETSTTDGKSAKSDAATTESKGTKVETGDSKSGKPEGAQAEGKSQKGEAGTRPGDHAPGAGKIAEVSPEGTRSGDIDRTGKVADVSGGSKSGDVSPHKLTDGKVSDVPTNKGPEIGLVGKTGESVGKGLDASDKSQDARGTGPTDRRGGADSKVPESKVPESGLAGGDRGGGLGTGWKGEQGSTPGGPKGQTTKEGQSERAGEEPNRSKRTGKEPSEQQGQDKAGGANKSESGNSTEKGKPETGKGVASPGGESTIKGGIKVDKGDAQAEATTAKGATKGGAGPKGKSAESSTSDPRTEVTKPPPRIVGDPKTPTITDGKGTGLAPTIKGGGFPGVSMPDWLVKPDSKKSTKGSKGKGDSERPDQTQQTKAIRKETERAERKPPVDAESKDKIEKPRVDLLLPGKSRKDPGAFVQDRSQKQPSGKDGKSAKDTPQKKDELDKKESKQTHPEQNQRTVREDAMLNQPTRKVPMQLAGRDTVPLPAIGRGAEKVAEKPQEKATPPAANLMGNRDAVMSLLLGKGKSGGEKVDKEPDSAKSVEEGRTVEAKSALPPAGTISGVLGGSKKVSRLWQASESGTFKLSSSDSLNAMRTDAMLPSERLTQSDSPRKSSLNWIRDQYAAKRELQSKQRRQYISQPGDHLGLIAVKTVGRTSPALERLLLQLNPHLEVRRQYSAEHNTDVSYLEPGSIVSLPTVDEVQEVP